MTMKKAMSVMVLLAMFNMAHAATRLNSYWSGFYGGFNADAVFNYVKLNANNAGLTNITGTCEKSAHYSSFSPGVQLGFERQFDYNVVLGVEGSFNYNTYQQKSLNCDCPFNSDVSDQFSFYTQAQGSLLGRIGYALGDDYSIIPFFAGGVSLANLGLKYHNEIGDRYRNNSIEAGWVVGAGVEWRMDNAWSLRAEYSYIDYNDVNMHINTIYGLTDPNGRAHAALQANNLDLAVNYWF